MKTKKILLTSILAVMLAVSPMRALATASGPGVRIDDLRAQVNSLISILNSLITQLQLPQQPLPPIEITPVPLPVPVPEPLPLPHTGKYLKVNKSHVYAGDGVYFYPSHGDGNKYQPSATDGIDTRIDFGDGTPHKWVHCKTDTKRLFGFGECLDKPVIKHEYKTPGTYVARLVREGGYCAGQCPVTELARVKITVKPAITACTKEYKPVCGQPAGCSSCPDGAYCIALCQVPQPQTYGNMCELRRAGAKLLHKGKCEVKPEPSKNTAPVIHSFSGPTVLKVGERGVWRIKASDRENDDLTYNITWGDEYNMRKVSPMADMAAQVPVRQRTSFEHTYYSAGTYTVLVTVSDGRTSTHTTATVRVVAKKPVGKIGPMCKSWYDGCNWCSREYPGGPAMCTMRACQIGHVGKQYCSAWFDDVPVYEPWVEIKDTPVSETIVPIHQIKKVDIDRVVNKALKELPTLSFPIDW